MSETKPQQEKIAKPANHDHNVCIKKAILRAEKLCADEGERFTNLRRQVLELIWAEHKPVKAYDLLSTLSGMRSGVAPTTVYRTLDFLQEQGLVHKIESLNAYMGCSQPDESHSGHFFICESCSEVTEIENAIISEGLKQAAEDEAFAIRRETVELFGLCSRCQTEPDARVN